MQRAVLSVREQIIFVADAAIGANKRVKGQATKGAW